MEAGRSSGLFRLWGSETARDQWTRYRDDYRLHLLSEQGRTRTTTDTYLYHVGVFSRWCQREHTTLSRATNKHLLRYYAESLENRARSTAVGRILALRSFYRWLITQRVRKGDPTAGISARRGKQEPPPPYTESELRALLDACLWERDRVLLLLLIGTACRREEVLRLRTADIDWRHRELRIHGKGNKERRVAPGERAMRSLRGFVNGQTGHIWFTQAGEELTGHRLYLNLQDIARRARVTAATVHRFRVTAANNFLADGMKLDELQQVMGHADIKTTAHYASFTVTRRALIQQARLSMADRL